MIDRTCKPGRRVTLAGDKLFDASSFVAALRMRKVTPRIAVNGTVSKLGKVRKTLIDKRTLRHEGYAKSLRVPKRTEEAFGWAKTIGGIAKLKVRGRIRAEAAFTFRMIAYNLARLPKLLEARASWRKNRSHKAKPPCINRFNVHQLTHKPTNHLNVDELSGFSAACKALRV